MCWKIIKFEILKMKLSFLFLFALCSSLGLYAQDGERKTEAVVTNSFWDNWYAQVGVDMNLTFLKDHPIKDVFPNGKSFGINAAIGKWFSPEIGVRLKTTWNNGILRNDQNTWLRPYGMPGENHRNGGFVTVLGDIQLNLHNLISVYNPNRRWNLIAGVRGGAWLDVGSHAGAPILGVGIINTYRLSNRWRLMADVGYHFVASINGYASGKRHGGNSFGEIAIGAEMDLSKNNTFHKLSQSDNARYAVINSLWDNWFVQAGIGMSLINPCGTNFANVFPNGSTWGVNVGLGKWFTPDIGIRGGLNWQNGILINYDATYLHPREGSPGTKEIEPVKASEGDPNKHSYVAVYADVFFNLHNIFGGYDNSRSWNAIVYPRLGLVRNFASEFEEGPILGIGTEQAITLNNKWKLFADLNYQVTTGSFLDGKFDSGDTGSNGWFDINVGIQYDLGKNWWDKPGDQRKATHWEGGHNWPRFFVNTGASVIVAFGAKTALKAIVSEERPDHSDNKSFPSGHASMAFAAARSIDKEFRKDCIWIPIAGYAAATAIGVERVVNKHHHWYDVVAGAAIGIGSAELTWWLSDLLFAKHNRQVAIGASGNTLDVAVNF